MFFENSCSGDRFSSPQSRKARHAKEVAMMQDGTSKHTGKGIPMKLKLAGREDGWNTILVTLPA